MINMSSSVTHSTWNEYNCLSWLLRNRKLMTWALDLFTYVIEIFVRFVVFLRTAMKSVVLACVCRWLYALWCSHLSGMIQWFDFWPLITWRFVLHPALKPIDNLSTCVQTFIQFSIDIFRSVCSWCVTIFRMILWFILIWSIMFFCRLCFFVCQFFSEPL